MIRLAAWLAAAALFVPAAGRGVAPDLIEVDVQVLEIDRSRLHRAGLDWQRLLEGPPGAAAPASSLHVVEDAPPSLTALGTFSRGRVDAFLRMLEADRYGKLLAKPRLLALSGSQASFLVGGELPVVSQDTQGHTSVSWKEYGVRLTVRPERREGLIRTKVRAETSTVDAATAVTLPNGTYMPGLKTRWAETEVELAPQATVIVGGLIQSEETQIGTGVPVLMDLPLLGWLFRHTRLERSETELVIFVTPRFASAPSASTGS